MTEAISFTLNGETVETRGVGSLLDVLRDEHGVISAKDGCSPQGQCGCCTVWIDGAPRVACVTAASRVRGREVTTLEGLEAAEEWASALTACGGSQCGFCTPGIIMRLASLDRDRLVDGSAVDRALKAHLCRCTGWQTIREAAVVVGTGGAAGPAGGERDLDAAAQRASIEGRADQRVGVEVTLGAGGFAEDTAPPDALVAVLAADGSWVVGETTAEARAAAGFVPGRRGTAPLAWPIELPEGEWERSLQTTWLEPAALELDATWCRPGGDPAPVLGNGGAFGSKVDSDLPMVARRLADQHGRAVRVRWSREDSVRSGPKRPPLAVGMNADGTGVVTLVRPAAGVECRRLAASITAVAPGVDVRFTDVGGPPASAAVRAAGWAEVAAVCASLGARPYEVVSPDGSTASAAFVDGRLVIDVREMGDLLDEVVLRSYCIGAAHMAVGMVRSEGIAIDGAGTPVDLTIRSFGVIAAADMPAVDVVIRPGQGPAVNVSDAVFSAVLAAAWGEAGFPPRIPTGRGG